MSFKSRLRTTALVASALLFLASLPLPVWWSPAYLGETGEAPTPDPTYGLEVLLFGWIATLTHGDLAWLANPLWLVAIALAAGSVSPRWVPAALALLGSLAAASFLLSTDFLSNEAGHRSPILARGPGFWLWLSSFFTLLIATLLPPRPQTGDVSSRQTPATP